MKKQITYAILIAFICSQKLYSQHGFTDWEKTYFKNNASIEQQAFVHKIKLPDDLELPKVKLEKNVYEHLKYSWTAWLKRSFAAFFTEAKSYKYNKKVALVYGLFSQGNYDVFKYHQSLKQRINDTLWVEKTFLTMLPTLKESWQLLDKNTRAIYSQIIKHIDFYLIAFNYEEERRYKNQLIVLSKPEDFILKSINSNQVNDFRKAEAFIFRRIRDSKSGKGNWTIQWIKKIIYKIKANLYIA